MITTTITFDVINQLTAGKLGTFDVACPLCGPEKRTPVNQRRRVLRIWRAEEAFATFRCARCEEDGFVRRGVEPRQEAVDGSANLRTRIGTSKR